MDEVDQRHFEGIFICGAKGIFDETDLLSKRSLARQPIVSNVVSFGCGLLARTLRKACGYGLYGGLDWHHY